jgi:hypothetical protein
MACVWALEEIFASCAPKDGYGGLKKERMTLRHGRTVRFIALPDPELNSNPCTHMYVPAFARLSHSSSSDPIGIINFFLIQMWLFLS